MSIKSLVPSIGLCEKLGGIWPKDKPTVFCYAIYDTGGDEEFSQVVHRREITYAAKYYPAPTFREIWDQLPNRIGIEDKLLTDEFIGYGIYNDVGTLIGIHFEYGKSQTLEDAAAKLYIKINQELK